MQPSVIVRSMQSNISDIKGVNYSHISPEINSEVIAIDNVLYPSLCIFISIA